MQHERTREERDESEGNKDEQDTADEEENQG
jgi:hypothetical protein